MKIKDDAECYRCITIGKASFDQYWQKAMERLRQVKRTSDMNQVWTAQSAQRRRSGA